MHDIHTEIMSAVRAHDPGAAKLIESIGVVVEPMDTKNKRPKLPKILNWISRHGVFQPADEATRGFVKSRKDGETVRAVVVTKAKQRSTAQNSLMWMWLSEIADARNDTKEDMYQAVKKPYMVPILIRDDPGMAATFAAIHGVGGAEGRRLELSVIHNLVSSRQLSIKQFAEFLNDMERDARQRGIDLTVPTGPYLDALLREADEK